MSIEKRFCCLFCKSGPLSVDVQLPSSGFVPGQIVPISIDVENGSNVDVHNFTISLRQYITYKADSPRYSVREETNDITEVSIGGVSKFESLSEVINATVPTIPPSNLLFCNLIDLEYSIKVRISIHSNCYYNCMPRKTWYVDYFDFIFVLDRM